MKQYYNLQVKKVSEIKQNYKQYKKKSCNFIHSTKRVKGKSSLRKCKKNLSGEKLKLVLLNTFIIQQHLTLKLFFYKFILHFKQNKVIPYSIPLRCLLSCLRELFLITRKYEQKLLCTLSLECSYNLCKSQICNFSWQMVFSLLCFNQFI